MDKKRILTPAVVTSVALIHVGLVALLWHAHKPPPVEMANIEFVDLGDFGGGDGSPEGEGAPAAPAPTRGSSSTSTASPALVTSSAGRKPSAVKSRR